MLYSILLATLVLGKVCLATELGMATIVQKLQQLENKLEQQENTIQGQHQIIVQQEQMLQEHRRIISQQENQIKLHQERISRLEGVRNTQKASVTNLEEPIADNKSLNRCSNCNKETTSNASRDMRFAENVLPSMRVNRQSAQIAFTSFLDHTVHHLGIDHPIIYNRVLLNEGSAYNPTSGMFTCPMSGLYVFYFSVSSYGLGQAVVKLVVNGVNQVDAISDTYHNDQEAQGANLAIVSLISGQQVWVANYRWSEKSVVVSNVNRFSTFSGFLLY